MNGINLSFYSCHNLLFTIQKVPFVNQKRELKCCSLEKCITLCLAIKLCMMPFTKQSVQLTLYGWMHNLFKMQIISASYQLSFINWYTLYTENFYIHRHILNKSNWERQYFVRGLLVIDPCKSPRFCNWESADLISCGTASYCSLKFWEIKG